LWGDEIFGGKLSLPLLHQCSAACRRSCPHTRLLIDRDRNLLQAGDAVSFVKLNRRHGTPLGPPIVVPAQRKTVGVLGFIDRFSHHVDLTRLQHEFMSRSLLRLCCGISGGVLSILTPSDQEVN
jgi:hypothetical protein